jgi:hypothetical protein
VLKIYRFAGILVPPFLFQEVKKPLILELIDSEVKLITYMSFDSFYLYSLALVWFMKGFVISSLSDCLQKLGTADINHYEKMLIIVFITIGGCSIRSSQFTVNNHLQKTYFFRNVKFVSHFFWTFSTTPSFNVILTHHQVCILVWSLSELPAHMAFCQNRPQWSADHSLLVPGNEGYQHHLPCDQ